MFTILLQILGGIGGLGAVFMGIRSLYFLRVEHRGKRNELTHAQQAAAVQLMAAQSPEVARLTERLRSQDEYITELEERLRKTRRDLLEVQMFADSLNAKCALVDSQLASAQIELSKLRNERGAE